jgi:penicillin-binding protein 2
MNVTTSGGDLRNAYRFGAFALAVVIGITSLSAKMVSLQLLSGSQAAQAGDNTQATGTDTTQASRGLIYDATGHPLVKNVVDFSVTVTPADLPLKDEPTVAARLSSVLSLDPIYIETQIDSATGSLTIPVKIADGVSSEVARFIEENSDQLPGVEVVEASKRDYLTKELFADIIGYEGQITALQYAKLKALGYSSEDVVGQAGLENYYEQDLRGTPGTQTVALASGKPIPGLVTESKKAVPGDSLTLNIDTSEQQLAYQALSWGLEKSNVTRGVIIVENPQNGKILAMVSLPTYDDQLFADGISQTNFQKLLDNPDQPLLNKAVGSQYAPGSTFKLVTGTAGLQDGVIDTTSTINSQPFVAFGGYRYNEWDGQGWGPLNIYQGVAYSSDTFFYQLAQMVGLDRLTYWADQYGFGKPTGIDLPETATGIVPTNAWKASTQGQTMYEGELMQAGIGQGYDVATPMQLLNAYCAMANGGNLWQPQIVKSIASTDGTTTTVTDIQPVLLNRLPVSQDTLETMRVATRQVVTSRHTYNLVDLPIAVAGKTGTAEFGVPDRLNRLPYHEWFVGYTPGNPYSDDFTKPDSQLAVVAFLYGANTWGNMATEVVKYYMMLHYKLPGYRDPTNPRTAGYTQSWIWRTTNYYGSPNRD